MANKMTKFIFFGLVTLTIFFGIFLISLQATNKVHARLLPDTSSTIPSRVLPTLVSTDAIEFNNVYTSKFNELYFTRAAKDFSKSQLWLARYSGDKQVVEPLKIEGLVESQNTSDVHLSPNGQSLFFIIEADQSTAHSQLFMAHRDGNVWGDLEKVQLSPEQSTKDIYYPNTSKNGNLYFSQRNKDSSLDIYRAEKTLNGYTTPVKLPEYINTNELESDAFIAPDESYLIFSRMHDESGEGMSDLYISFNTANHENSKVKWSSPINMSIYNTEYIEGSPYVTIDGMTLLFTSNRGAKKPDDFDGNLDLYSAKFDIELWKKQLK